MYFAVLISTFSLIFVGSCHARWVGIPTAPFEAASSDTTFSLTKLKAIIVDAAYQDAVDTTGETLIPPTLKSFADTFSEDLQSTLGLHVPVEIGHDCSENSIFLTIGSSSRFIDAAGRFTAEGYSILTEESSITVTGASSLGAWWATRTILQHAALNRLEIEQGSVVDAPAWRNRGVMLDTGRHYYEPSFLIELCSYLSFFKQNVFHLHLSDNLYNNVEIYTRERSREIYASFRLNSDDPALEGLSNRPNESYYRNDFEEIQQKCASRGVTIIPEIEAPGHAMVITDWKPSLALDDFSMLNISNPDTIPTMKTIWGTLLPWMHSKTVHIGADEYDSNFVDDYALFVNEMNNFMAQSDKDIRIWGTFPKAEIAKNVSIQHWEFFEDNPYFEYIQNDYDVLNSDDAFYVVNKWSGSYPQSLNLTRTFNGAPDGHAFAANIFDTKNATNNPPRHNPRVLGHLAAIWNDLGPNATSQIETYYALRNGLPALGDKIWGGDLTMTEYTTIFETLHAAIPGSNLDRRIPSLTPTIYAYNFTSPAFPTNNKSLIPDSSGNNYHAINNGCFTSNGSLTLTPKCSISTPFTSKGRNYTLSFTIKPTTSNPGPLFSGSGSILAAGNGTSNKVMMISGGNAYALNYTLPIGVWTSVSLVGAGRETWFVTKGGNGTVEKEEEFHQFLVQPLGVNGDSFVWDQPMAFEAPIGLIGGGGLEGEIRDVVLRDGQSLIP